MVRPAFYYAVHLAHHPPGKGSFNKGGITLGGEDEVMLKHDCDTPITLGILVDIVYELADISGDKTEVEFEIALDEEGNPNPWPQDHSPNADGEKDPVPEYHKAMVAAHPLKEV